MNPNAGKTTLKIKLTLVNFNEANLLNNAFLDKANYDKKYDPSPKSKKAAKNFEPQHYTQRAVFDTVSQKYYLLVIFNSCLILQDDLCVQIKTISNPSNIEPFKFYYWLPMMYVRNQQGKTKRLSVKNNIKRNQFINLNNITNYEDSTYDELERQGTLKHE